MEVDLLICRKLICFTILSFFFRSRRGKKRKKKKRQRKERNVKFISRFKKENVKLALKFYIGLKKKNFFFYCDYNKVAAQSLDFDTVE